MGDTGEPQPPADYVDAYWAVYGDSLTAGAMARLGRGDDPASVRGALAEQARLYIHRPYAAALALLLADRAIARAEGYKPL